MLRPGMLLALPLTGTFVDTLLRTDFAIRRYPSYAGAWPFPRPDFHRLEDACLAGHAVPKRVQKQKRFCTKPYCDNSSNNLRILVTASARVSVSFGAKRLRSRP